MRKITGWAARHRSFAFFFFSLLIVTVYSVVLYILDVSFPFIIVIDLLLIWVSYVFVESCPMQLIKKPLKAMEEQGDPYPLFAETETLLGYKLSERNKQLILIDHAVALRNIGAYEKTYEILSAINIDKVAGMPPIVKFVYYNNLADVCTLTERHEAADIWYVKMMQLYFDLPQNKVKESLREIVLSADVGKNLRAGDYAKMLELLSAATPKALAGRVDNAMLAALAYWKQNNLEKTKENLRFVIENGNKLYIVTVAQKLLADLEETNE